MPAEDEITRANRMQALGERLLTAIGTEDDPDILAAGLGALVGVLCRLSANPVTFLGAAHQAACNVIDGSAIDV